jgi:hypothetical protein
MTNKLATLILLTTFALLLAACGASSTDVPSLRSVEDAQEAEPAASVEDVLADSEAKMMVFTQCMRDQGVDLLDPVVDAEGNVGIPQLAAGAEWTNEDKATWEACNEHLEGFVFERKRVDMSEQVDQAVDLAACLRDKGYDVADPTAETLAQWQGDFKYSINWDDPAAVADYEECSGSEVGGGKGK